MKKQGLLVFMSYGLLLVGVMACMRPEKPWSRPTGGEMATITANLGPEYDTVAFVSLSLEQVHKVPRIAWDLEIHSVEGGYQVWTNAAMYAFAALMDSVSWQNASDVSSIRGWRCDLPDTAALSILRYGERMTLILDRDKGGVFYNTPANRYRKLWLMATEQGIEIKAYTLTGEPMGEWRILRLPEPQYLSLDRSGQVVSVLPPWKVELILIRYVHYYPDQPEAFRYYPVMGALMPKGLRAAVLNAAQVTFEDFTYAGLSQVAWQTRRDAIGYDWKRYDFDTGTYLIDYSRYYALEVETEQYYKLQFIDFYDESGRKGSVKVRYSAL